MMRVKTVRQVKQQQMKNKNGLNNYSHTNHSHSISNNNNSSSNTNNNINSSNNNNNNINSNTIQSPNANPYEIKSTISPPYRMPPKPPGMNMLNQCDEIQIPGATTTESADFPNQTLRTHSSKFPIERELILSTDKNGTKISLINDANSMKRNVGLQFLSRPSGATIAPDHPVKQMQAWNTQAQSHMEASLSNSMARTPARLPEDVTNLAMGDRENNSKDLKEAGKNPVSKTYHTLKDLISSKFKKENNDIVDELNNMTITKEQEFSSPYYALPLHMRQTNQMNNSHSNVLQSRQMQMEQHSQSMQSQSQIQSPHIYNQIIQGLGNIPQKRASSQPHLLDVYERREPQFSMDSKSNLDRRVSSVNIEVTDSDDGGFINKTPQRPLTNMPNAVQSAMNQHPQQYLRKPLQPQTPKEMLMSHQGPSQLHLEYTQHRIPESAHTHQKLEPPPIRPKPTDKDISRKLSGDDNPNSNVDSGRGSIVNSSGRKTQGSPESVDLAQKLKSDSNEWIDVVDTELRNILEPTVKIHSMPAESIVSGSISSISPPLPPLSPTDERGANRKTTQPSNSKQEYGTDTYNKPRRATGPIGPSRAGMPGSSLQKQGQFTKALPAKKQLEQSTIKRHLFGLDVDVTSTTTRSFDLESLLGGPWGGTQSVSDSEADTHGLRHIKSQLEGLESMYNEVLKMLGSRSGDTSYRSNRRRHGSLSSLPSSSISGKPIRDRRRTDERRKVRDIKGINKRFQRLESHVVTLARSVAHLSSEMRSQHLVTQELEELRTELAALKSPNGRNTNGYRSTAAPAQPETPNLTNPKRVKKLTKFFGEDPPLMRLFLKKLGYEKYAPLFESERVGMIELPYLGEERLQKLGVPLGPRLRILQEAQISLCKDTTLCIV